MNLKFRVWDKDLKKMHVCGEDIHDSISFDEDGAAYYYNLQNGCGSIGDDSVYILMRYSGRKTWDEKEIYEGDVLDYTVFDPFDGDTRHRGIVKWLDEFAAFILVESTDSKEGHLLYWALILDDSAEKIGNIHENPELLGVSGL